jgi:flagellar basal body rod protein FlgG
MDPAYYVAAGSLKARSFELELISNNLANVDTVGYKTERSFFSVFNKANDSMRDLPLTGYVNDGTVLASSAIDFSQGASKATGHSLDIAIEGNGFLQVQTPRGVQATRDGRLKIGEGGQLQSLDGSPVLGKNGQTLTVNPQGDPLTFTSDGTLQQGTTVVGQLDIKAYETPYALKRVGSNRYDATGLAETAAKATVAQGHLEQSTVDAATSMIDMIKLNRLYEMSMKVASTLSNDLDANTLNYVANQR